MWNDNKKRQTVSSYFILDFSKSVYGLVETRVFKRPSQDQSVFIWTLKCKLDLYASYQHQVNAGLPCIGLLHLRLSEEFQLLGVNTFFCVT